MPSVFSVIQKRIIKKIPFITNHDLLLQKNCTFMYENGTFGVKVIIFDYK